MINILSWKVDDELTKDVKLMYSNLKTEKELENFKVYVINTKINTNKKNLVIQPYISVILKEEIYNCITESFLINRYIK